MTATDLARKGGQSKTPTKAAAARVNGRAGRQSTHPAVVAAREWWQTLSAEERDQKDNLGHVIVCGREVCGWSRDIDDSLCKWGAGVLAIPVRGGKVMRHYGDCWMSARVRCGPLLPTPEPTGYVCAPYLRDLARQIHELRDAWQIAEVQRALNSAAELIERLQRA